jgi:hypothetical protein
MPAVVTEPEDEQRPGAKDDREVDYLVCSQCGTPCYVFEMEDGRIAEAMCLVCGNDDVALFSEGEEEAGGD